MTELDQLAMTVTVERPKNRDEAAAVVGRPFPEWRQEMSMDPKLRVEWQLEVIDFWAEFDAHIKYRTAAAMLLVRNDYI